MKRQILFMLVALIFTHLEMSAQQNKTYASPMRIVIPTVSIDGNILYIYDEHPDYKVELLSADGTIIYESDVPADCFIMTFPENMVGVYELQMTTRSYSLTGNVN